MRRLNTILILMVVLTNIGCSCTGQNCSFEESTKNLTINLKDVKEGLYNSSDENSDTEGMIAFDLNRYIHLNTRQILSDRDVDCTIVFGDIYYQEGLFSYKKQIDGFTRSLIQKDGTAQSHVYLRGGWNGYGALCYHPDTLIHELLHATWWTVLTEEERQQRKTLVLQYMRSSPKNETLQFALSINGAEEVWTQIGSLISTGLFNNATSSDSSIVTGGRMKSKELPVEILSTYRGILKDEFLDPKPN